MVFIFKGNSRQGSNFALLTRCAVNTLPPWRRSDVLFDVSMQLLCFDPLVDPVNPVNAGERRNFPSTTNRNVLLRYPSKVVYRLPTWKTDPSVTW